MPVAVHVSAVSKTYGRGDNTVAALRDVTISFAQGTFTAVMGPSGSGKSTLMHCAAGLDTPDSGRIVVGEHDLGDLDDVGLTELRRENIGFVFQSFNLLPSLTVVQNIELPLRLAGRKIDRAQITKVVDAVDLTDRVDHLPSELSGGQQQRVAIARALAAEPSVIFADEPTGALDTRTAGDVLTLLRELVVANGHTIVMVTHDPVAASYADRVVFLADGQFVGDMHGPTASAVADRMTHLDTRHAVVGGRHR